MGPARFRILLLISLLLFSDAAFFSFSDLLLYPPQPVNLSSFLRQIRSLRICLPVPVRMLVSLSPVPSPLLLLFHLPFSLFCPARSACPLFSHPWLLLPQPPPLPQRLPLPPVLLHRCAPAPLGKASSSFPIRCLLCLLSQRASAAGQARRMQVFMIHSGSRSARCRRMRTGILRSSHRGRLPGVPGNAFPGVPS